MDPTEALRRLRQLLCDGHSSDRRNTRTWQASLREAGEIFRDLDTWLAQGGVLPMDWIASTTNTAYGRALRHLCKTIRERPVPASPGLEPAVEAAERVIRGEAFSC